MWVWVGVCVWRGGKKLCGGQSSLVLCLRLPAFSLITPLTLASSLQRSTLTLAPATIACNRPQPVQGDWRQRFGAASTSGGEKKKSSKSSKPPSSSSAAAAAASASGSAAAAAVAGAPGSAGGGANEPLYPKKSKTKPDLDWLSRGLPQGWRAVWEKDGGDIYYENATTKVRGGGRGEKAPGFLLRETRTFPSTFTSQCVSAC